MQVVSRRSPKKEFSMPPSEIHGRADPPESRAGHPGTAATPGFALTFLRFARPRCRIAPGTGPVFFHRRDRPHRDDSSDSMYPENKACARLLDLPDASGLRILEPKRRERTSPKLRGCPSRRLASLSAAAATRSVHATRSSSCLAAISHRKPRKSSPTIPDGLSEPWPRTPGKDWRHPPGSRAAR